MQSHRDASNDSLWAINCLSHQEKRWYQKTREINTTLLVYIGDSDTTMLFPWKPKQTSRKQ